METRGILAAAILAATLTSASAGEQCTDVALALLADVSHSMDERERRVQRQGYAEAFRHPEVIHAITGGFCGRIDVAYIEYAANPVVVMDWRTVEDAASSYAVSLALSEAPAPDTSIGTQTAIGNAMALGGQMLRARTAHRYVMDVSSDGPDNMQRNTDAVRSDLTTGTEANGWREITINGLIVGKGDHLTNDQLADWYGDHVVGGPGHFVLRADDVSELAEIVRRKLVQEIG